jgi:hypothetical protein
MPKGGSAKSNAKRFGPNPRPALKSRGPAKPATMQGGAKKRGR